MMVALGAKPLDLSRNAVVEAGTDGQQYVRMLDGHVRLPRPVHAGHSEPEGIPFAFSPFSSVTTAGKVPSP